MLRLGDEIWVCDLSSDTTIIDRNWFVTFITTNTKLVIFFHQRAEPIFVPVIMNSHWGILPGASIRRQVRPSPRVQLVYNICKEAEKIVGPLSRSRKYLIPPVVLHLYKSQTRPKILPYLCWICMIPKLQPWQISQAFMQLCGGSMIFHLAATFPKTNIASFCCSLPNIRPKSYWM